MIANANRDHEDSRLEQAALRRIATLVARGVQPHELFAAVAEEVGRVVGAPCVAVVRYESDDTATVCGAFPPQAPLFRTGTRVSLEGADALALIREHAEPERVDDYAELEGEIADAIRSRGMRSSIGVPIVVAGRVWGAILASGTERLRENAEARLAELTELVAAAISETEAREVLTQLADEQAALRRVAKLVAQGASPADVFAAVSAEVDRLLRLAPDRPDIAGVVRFDPGPEHVVVGVSKRLEAVPLGSRWPPIDLYAPTRVLHTGRSARIGEDDLAAVGGPEAAFLRDNGYLSQVASPIVVDGRLWGAISANSAEELPPDTEERLETFIELIAMAIANAESHEALAQLADEQAALRRVATLVARGTPPDAVFQAVADDVVALLGCDTSAIVRFEADGAATLLGGHRARRRLGERFVPDRDYVLAAMRKSGHAARFDTNDPAAPGMPEPVRAEGIQSGLATPITVGGELWGAITVASLDVPFPAGTERRLADFTELIATAIANAESHDALARLAEEQAALRGVATRVAEGAPATSLFATVADEVAAAIGVPTVTVGRYGPGPTYTVMGGANLPGFPVGSQWPLDGPSLAKTVFDEARPARIEDYSGLPETIAAVVRSIPILSAVGAPIVVDGRVWGYISVSATDPEPLPPDTEERLDAFARLVATAISKAESHEALARLVAQQAALRRVATLVAEGAEPAELFTAVAWEIGQLFDFAAVTLNRYEEDAVVVLADPLDSGFPVGSRWPFDGDSLAVRVHATRRMARIDDYSDIESSAAARMRARASRSAIGVPIFVEGDLWGLLCVGAAATELLPADTADRIAGFVELVGTAISNGQARDRLRMMAEEQAALGRVAKLVAEGAPPDALFRAVADEVASVVGPPMVTLSHHHADGSFTVVASTNNPGFPVGSRWLLDGPSLAATIQETGRAARIDDYSNLGGAVAAAVRDSSIRAAAGAPIVVDGKVWGHISVAAKGAELLPGATEQRLHDFTDLIATAIANAESRDALARLADEQAALRRVATLVARDAPSTEVFDAVATEVGRLLDTDITVVGRYDDDGSATAIGSWSASPGGIAVGTRSAIGGHNVLTLVAETERPARVDGYDDASGEAAEIARRHGWRSSIAAPIIVDGRLWGVMLVATQRPEPFPPDAEERVSAFTDLVATAIANAEGKSELAASRRRIVAAADDARRRIERDLHDGIQQRLVALVFRARTMTRRPQDELAGLAAELAEGLKDVSDELREVSRGIHPTILTEAGLGPALRALARRSNVPVDVDVRLEERLPAPVEAAAYYIASEALTNVEKHARANVVELIAAHDDRVLTLEVRDDGIGGVDAGRGSGILGLTDRVEALGGTISIASPPRGGTTLSVRLPSTA